MARPFRHHVDDEILDRAAALFARHGFEQTSVKALADAVGLSKAGLLHHYPTKEALYEAARKVGDAQARRVLDQVAPLPPGPARDRRALELLTDIALDRPGLVALAFRSVTASDAVLDDQDVFVSEVFAVDAADTERQVRVIGALSALAVLSLAANLREEKTAWRPLIIATCSDALASRPNQVEA
ncbi:MULTISPECIES: TetR/AcrR family transcriptional regulator [Actinokineospora]|uniref:HTH tetR-type domain-containing protein n=1 Tax=Actinokineospora fastidiosa TaxID=1816 RepID=A0A918LCB2_9PSEU|nr:MULTISPECIES: TetR/AcrR family transcriptional regulator [Actinokineospora]UVS79824.1 HTH-type transcriptional repressor AcnR [Actinokineospora sp. UTMC 2448]GGS31078.1 hypothetical protein GCM10010171_26150 [Actinokineospora fastidiosa]